MNSWLVETLASWVADSSIFFMPATTTAPTMVIKSVLKFNCRVPDIPAVSSRTSGATAPGPATPKASGPLPGSPSCQRAPATHIEFLFPPATNCPDGLNRHPGQNDN